MATDIVNLPNAVVQGDLTVNGTIYPGIARTQLVQEANARFQIPMEHWRVWDAFATNLPGTAASDDLALIGGTLGTNAPSIQTGDLKAAGATTRYARCTFNLPHNYDTGQTVTIRAHAGMKTTVADGSATIDFQVYESDREDGVSADLCTTSATTINSTTEADKDFAITSSALAPGDILDIRMAVTVTDAATATAVIGFVGCVEVLLDVKG